MQTVVSRDGTRIAYDRVGDGPALILVAGAMGTRNDQFSSGLARLLSLSFTVYSYDRRGRGGSTETKPYAVQREIDDIESLIDVAGGSGYLFGMSSGGALVLEAAISLKQKVRKSAVYEVPYDDSEAGIQAWHNYRTQLSDAIQDNRPGDAVALFMRLVGVPDDMLEGMRQGPFWKGMEAMAPTLLYDAACLGDDRTVPVERVKNIATPILLLDGSESLKIMPFMVASAERLANTIPSATRKTLEGQRHDVDANALAPVLIDFFT